MNRTLVYHDGTLTKFWRIKLAGRKYSVTFGKAGCKGLSRTKSFRSEDACRQEAEKMVRERLERGYLEDIYEDGGLAWANQAKINPYLLSLA